MLSLLLNMLHVFFSKQFIFFLHSSKTCVLSVSCIITLASQIDRVTVNKVNYFKKNDED